MYFIYIDESGKPNYKEKSDFILSALIIRENSWYKVSSEINNLKIHYFGNTEVEFHAYDIFNGSKEFRPKEIIDRGKILTDLVNIIIENSVELISIVFQKYKSFKKPDINEWSFRLLLERLCKYLDRENYKNYQNNLPMDYGLLMIDSVERKFDSKIRRHILNFYEDGSYYQNNKYLIEDPIFVKSHFRNLSQLSDTVAFITKRYYDMQKPENVSHRASKPGHQLEEVIKTLFEELMKESFVKCKYGSVKGCGMKFFPE